MKKRLIVLPAVALVATAFSGLAAGAHQCEDPDDPETCEETSVQPNWRDGNYIPLFDLDDREDPDQRYDAQRWRDECDNGRYDSPDYQSRQLCWWAYGGSSLFPNRGEDAMDPNSYSPNEFHAGFAATHCFLQEFAHQCEDHEASRGEGVHDAHGGATYVDICLTENPESKYCDDGLQDTQVGLTIMDHLPCGFVVPIVACIDEYHVIRPFDTEYTQRQMSDPEEGNGTAEYIPRILEDPELYLCGYEQYRDGLPICPGDGGGAGITASPGDVVRSSGTRAAADAAGAGDASVARAMRAMRAGEMLAARGAVGSPLSRAGSGFGLAGLLVVTLAWRLRRLAAR
jgi:hypothetical protein